MKTFVIAITIMLTGIQLFAQVSCEEIMADADHAAHQGRYRDAILKYNAAQICDPTLISESNEKILHVFEKIQDLRELAEERESVAEKNIQKLAALIGEITSLLQRDENQAIIGLEPLRTDIFQLILPYTDFVIKNSRFDKNIWGDARIYYSIGISLGAMGKEGSFELMEKAFQSSIMTVRGFAENREEPPNELFRTLLGSGRQYAWLLINQNQLNMAEEVLISVMDHADLNKMRSAALIYDYAGLMNVYSQLEKAKGNGRKGLAFQLQAIELARKASSLAPSNIIYQNALSVYLRNLKLIPDSLLSFYKKDEYNLEGCLIAQKIRNTPGAGTIGLTTFVSCIYEESYAMARMSNYIGAVKLLEAASDTLSRFIHLDPLSPVFYLHRARLQTRLSEIAIRLDARTKAVSYLRNAKKDWIEVLEKQTVLPNYLTLIANIYYDIREIPLLTKDTTQLFLHYKKISRAVNSSLLKYKRSNEIELIAADGYSNLGAFILKYYEEYDYDTLLRYFSKAIEHFHRSQVLENIQENSKAYSWFANAYFKRIYINKRANKLDLVLEDAQSVRWYFEPVLKRFPFNECLKFYVSKANQKAGEMLFERKRYKESISFFAFASKWGSAESAFMLAEIYRSGMSGENDERKADSLYAVARNQDKQTYVGRCDLGL